MYFFIWIKIDTLENSGVASVSAAVIYFSNLLNYFYLYY
nr:ALPV-340 [Albatrosspox virus]